MPVAPYFFVQNLLTLTPTAAPQSIGAALSTTLAGLVVVKAGYSAGFITLGAVGAIGALVCLLALPETRKKTEDQPPHLLSAPPKFAAE